MVIMDDDASHDVEPCCDADIIKSTKKIVKRLLFCLLVFYCIYYCLATFFHGLFRVNDKFSGFEPFNFKLMSTLNFQSGRTNSFVFFIMLELTYLITTIIMAIYLQTRVWDYAITLTVVHSLISTAVMGQFPTNWQWWVAMVIGLLWMIVMGECLSYFFRHWYEKRKK